MLYLGCPIWTAKSWSGSFVPQGTVARDALAAYSRRLNMVEGNTTFYGIPSRETVSRWREEAAPEFRFCLKFPRVISHDLQLTGCDKETGEWIDRLRLLEKAAGPSFLQLPRDFGPNRLPLLANYLEALPQDLAFAVEPRHPDWFSDDAESALNALLASLGMARVLYDVRPLRAAEPTEPAILKAKQSKPHVPARAVRTAPHTLIRYISHPDLSANAPWLTQWKTLVAKWLRDGSDVYFCMHSIHEADMPLLCRDFHTLLSAELESLPSLPDWSAASEESQLSLF